MSDFKVKDVQLLLRKPEGSTLLATDQPDESKGAIRWPVLAVRTNSRA